MKAKGNLLITAGLLLIAAALCLFGYNMYLTKSAGDSANATIQAMQTLISSEDPTKVWQAQLEQAAQEAVADEERAAHSGFSAGEITIPDYVLDPTRDMPGALIDEKEYVGYISVPVLGLNLPVLSEWSYENLRIAPCRYVGTAYQPGFVIAAHNYTTHFGTLKTLVPGAQVFYTDMDGNEFAYEVAEVDILQPTAVEDMISKDWDLTLFTCTVGGASRVTVRCLRAAQP